MAYEYDTESWPVAQFRFIGRLDSSDLDRYFSDADALVQGNRSYACVMDGRTMLVPEVEFVRRQAQWIRANEADMLRVNRGIALVAASALVRGLVRAVLHITPIPVPYEVFSDLGDGMAWARTRALTSLAPRPSKLPKD